MTQMNNTIFARVLALMLCVVMLAGTLLACDVTGGNVTTGGGSESSSTTTGDSVNDEPVEDVADPNEIFSASATIEDGALILGALKSGVLIGDYESVNAIIPEDVKIADGASSLALSVKKVLEDVELALGEGDTAQSLDVHVEGIALDNDVPMIVNLGAILEAGLKETELKLYHFENGKAALMTRVGSLTDFAIHNQYYYNEETGEVSIYVASFSVFSAVTTSADEWDGTVDTSWYNETDTEFTLDTAEELAGFRALVDGGNTFEGKTVTLGVDVNLASLLFDPIGYGYYDESKVNSETGADTNTVFMGTFDGGNHTIYNLYQNGWDLDPDKESYSTYTYSTAGGGLFASIKNATVKNLVVSGANIVFECVDMGIVVGYAQGVCHFENIVVTDSSIANYNRATGAVVGEVCYGPYGTDVSTEQYSHTFKNILVDSNVVVSSLWGSFDTLCGGVIGGKWGDATVKMENVIVAAELDVYSDVTAAYQWYAYRRCGMLIGHTEQNSPKKALNAAAEFLACVNVDVYYGDWTEYNYYQFTNQNNDKGNRYPWVRAEQGRNNGAFSNPRYGNPIVLLEDASTVTINTVELAEEHCTDHVVITFNQLYGGGQGVYGTNEHVGNGVEIHYNSESTTVYISNDAGWENLKLYYWFANGADTWTTLIDGIDMSGMLVEGNVYKIEFPAYAYGFKIMADEAESEEFLLENIEDKSTVILCDHETTTTKIENEVASSCTAEGSYDNVVYCAVCDKEISRETVTVDAKGHTPGDEATCTVDQTCTVCGAVIKSALGHTEAVDEAVAATCTTAGKTEGKHCSVCGETIVAQTTIAALGHKYDNDCDTTCNTCGATRTVGDHKWYNTSYTCTECGEKAETKTVYFQNNWLWDDIRIYYYWDEGSYNEAWPGKAMELVGYDGTNEYYKLELPTYADTFVISGLYNDNNEKRDQTSDLDFSSVSTNTVYSCSSRGTGDSYHYVTMTAKSLSNYKYDDISKYEQIFLTPNSWWTSDSARFSAYMWADNVSAVWYSMNDKEADGSYSCWIPKDTYTYIIFCRMDGSQTTNDWSNKWNQTGDLTIPTNGDNWFKLTEYSWDSGTWSTK